MQVNELNVTDVNSFFSEYVKPADAPANPQQQTETQPTQETLEGNPVELSDVQKFFEGAKVEETKKEEEKKTESSFQDLGKHLVEAGVILPFEDDSIPTSPEEFKAAFEGTYQQKAEEYVEKAFQERFENMSPVLQTVYRYAEMGITSANELKELINSAADYETVANLDVQDENHQAYIVGQQLLATGLDEEAVNEQIQDLKSLNKLQSMAERFYPVIKEGAELQIRQQFEEQKKQEETLNMYLETNAINTKYFLDNPTAFLPFNIQSNEYKNAIYKLAAVPVDYTESKEPVFAWEAHLKSLQYGTEEQYKDFLDTLAFIANKKAYRERVASGKQTKEAQAEFKKVKEVQPKAVAMEGNRESYTKPAGARQGPWSI